ncbi:MULTISPECIES: NAD-dependent succinate-semialdehyde dehydrogenase [Falsihalocynthiibacter]|uniref:NAD-dependent succinate-semialdehyde dehydrogenase n=1 Tax=Falsihalocynthiibacter TaxID=2854182 RepID=UPI0030018810
MSDFIPKILIGGTFRTTTDLAPIDVINPCTEEVLWQVPSCDASHVEEALSHARAALKTWSAVHGWQRASVLRGIAAAMTRRKDDLSKALSLEIGRPLSQAEGEANAAIEQFEWFAGEAERLFGETIPSRQGGRLVIESEPVGIVAAFTAWNFPINLVARKIAPALAAGCPIICRPSEQTPMTSTIIAECCVEGGAPAGVVQLLQGRAENISPALMASNDVRKISLTGSTRVGQMLMAEAAKTVKRTSMELGGHAPVIVCEDADIDVAAELCATFKFRNAGQVCISPNRFYVHASKAERFIEKMVASAQELVVGDSQDAASTMGPISLASQRDRIEALIADTIKSGAKLRTGGGRPAHLNKGYYIEPTVFSDVPDDARIMWDEPFGPVAPIATFTDLDEVIERANLTPYGLAAYAFTGSHKTAETLSKGLHAGMVGINNFLVAHAEAPFGGVDHSGSGREGGQQAIYDYLNTKLTHFTW